MSLYLASYDISDDKRRAKVARFLLQFGARLQKSVFEIDLDPDEIAEFRRDVGSILSQKDLFVLVPVDERGSRSTLSWQRELRRMDAVIVL
ncbi:CRISPR-associated protein Cas2 [Pirellula staleyi DSM 6068]|uniref:CRISPR-associated endoribonuclease Cas2 n=1 Tax=Pirellula staleyi (strain ATCC 27377 / DSM 6068 / ICPB 4128) TaxID=530564 RepID=D2R8Z3_PIRSD|nr:CRISPR-associated endonuclease Cas2 [Pirellula staleyi]ADB15820.1 CRISPR-associated protein Cas2 [Pirellula staleyi DSM 6068]